MSNVNSNISPVDGGVITGLNPVPPMTPGEYELYYRQLLTCMRCLLAKDNFDNQYGFQFNYINPKGEKVSFGNIQAQVIDEELARPVSVPKVGETYGRAQTIFFQYKDFFAERLRYYKNAGIYDKVIQECTASDECSVGAFKMLDEAMKVERFIDIRRITGDHEKLILGIALVLVAAGAGYWLYNRKSQ